jgi:hypothetical protein
MDVCSEGKQKGENSWFRGIGEVVVLCLIMSSKRYFTCVRYWVKIFNKIDLDKSKTIDRKEFHAFLTAALEITREDVLYERWREEE